MTMESIDADNREMNVAWQFIANTGVSVFLTGKAGTGKTTFLRRLRSLTPKRMVVLAPTGVAAINAGGQTIHSFFQLPFGPFIPGHTDSEREKAYSMSQRKKDLIRTLDLLVIDEVSMVRADLLDSVDQTLRRYRDRHRPFGGVQLLLIGDLMQLSPVATGQEWNLLAPFYPSPYFFASKALQQMPYVTVELKHIYRQQDKEFIDLLASIRDGVADDFTLHRLNRRYIPDFKPDEGGWIRLTTHNAPAQQYNETELALLPGEPHTFKAQIRGEFPELSYPNEQTLTFKEGAQVMFVKNDLSGNHAYYNGKIGIVKGFEEGKVIVDCDDGREEIHVEPVEWENTRFTIDKDTKEVKEEVIGVFKQIPLRLAWAITVHKSQGLTFDRAVLDINDSFAHGQVYVALSRCRTLEGLVLANPFSPWSVKTDGSVNAYVDGVLAQCEQHVENLPNYIHDYLLTLLDEVYNFDTVTQDLNWLIRVLQEYGGKKAERVLEQMQGLLPPLEKALVDVARRFRLHYYEALRGISDIEGSPLQKRISDSAAYFRDKVYDIFHGPLRSCAVNIENKRSAEIFSNALAAIRRSVECKYIIFKTLCDEPFTVLGYLNLRAKAMLGEEPPRSRKVKAKPQKQEAQELKIPKAPKVNTVDETLRLYREGLDIAEIAQKRSLTEATIGNHMVKLVEDGRLPRKTLVTDERAEIVKQALTAFTGAYTLTQLKESLPEDFTYTEIKAALL